MQRPTIRALGALLALVLLVVACGDVTDESVEEPADDAADEAADEAVEQTPLGDTEVLRMATIGGGLYEEMYARLPDFTAETGIEVEIVFLGDGFQIDRKIKQDFAAGTLDYDVMWNHTSFAAQYVDFVEPLDAYLTDEDLADFTDLVIETSRHDGALQLLPRHADISVMHYRTDLFEDADNQAAFEAEYGYELRPPETWDEYYDVAEFFASPPELFGTQFAGKEEALAGRYYEQLVAHGGQFFDDDWRPAFNDEVGVRVAQDFANAYQNGVVPSDVTSLVWDGVAANWCSNLIAVHNEWYGWYSHFQDPESCEVAGNFGLARQPVGDAGVHSGWAGAHGFAVTATSENKEAAVELVKFLTSEEVLYEEASLGFLPVRDSVWDRIIADAEGSDEPLDLERMEIARVQIEEDFFTPPLIAEWIEFTNIFYPELQRIILGDIDAQEGLDEAAEQTERMLEEAGYYE